MCSASGRTLLYPARILDKVPLTLARIRTSLAATGMPSIAGLGIKQRLYVH